MKQCAEQLGESLGLHLEQYKGWKSCAKQDVFDRYSMAGEAIDAKMCRAAFLEGCGTNIDVAVKSGTLSVEQQEFMQCCSAEALDGDGKGACNMIEDGSTRGPCNDHPVCVNRITSEWIDCAVLP